jgi:UDP-N-acetylmuramoyl-tripeptide--D-alanyl-D-alanine ligase
MKKVVQYILKILAKLILAKYRPQVVGITGSIGKTSAKEAIGIVLASKFRIRSSFKNYNNEFGLPLTIIGAKSQGRSLIGWLAVIIEALKLLIVTDKNYPQILILEMGVDKPGDMDYLNSITSLNVAVLTMIGLSHLENFGNQAKLAVEKKKIFDKLDKSGWAILNLDGERVPELVKDLQYKIVTYGLTEGADVRATNLLFKFQEDDAEDDLLGISFKISYKDAYIPVLLPRAISQTAVSAALAGFAVGLAYDLNPLDMAMALGDFTPPPGRMNLLAGKSGSIIIDDTYNSAPQSATAALEILDQMNLKRGQRKWIVLADMLELGEASEAAHLAVGRRVAQIKKAQLLTLGQEALYIGIGAREAKMAEEAMQHFNNHQEIIDFLSERLSPGDIVLVKGSQGLRMEKIVAGIMAEPEHSEELLVRQGKDWQ